MERLKPTHYHPTVLHHVLNPAQNGLNHTRNVLNPEQNDLNHARGGALLIINC